MIHPSPSSLRVLPIARTMHHDRRFASCIARRGRVLPHARADCSMYVSLKCAVYLDRRWGLLVELFHHSMHATLALACRCVVEHATPLAVTHTACVCMLEMRASHGLPIAVFIQSPAHRAHDAS